MAQIKKYKELLVNSTGFVDPTHNPEVNIRLNEITRFFTDTSSSAALWVVAPNAGISIGGIQTNVQFPLFLEYYVLGRNAQLARGPAPPFYEKLALQIAEYLQTHMIPTNINPFDANDRLQRNFGSDTETMHTFDEGLVEMEYEGPGANPLPNPNITDIDQCVEFVQQFVNLHMPVTSCLTTILIYLTIGGYEIDEYGQFRRVFNDAVVNAQHQLADLVTTLGPIRQYGHAGDHHLQQYESPDEQSEMLHLPFDEQVERWPSEAQLIRRPQQSSSSNSSSRLHAGQSNLNRESITIHPDVDYAPSNTSHRPSSKTGLVEKASIRTSSVSSRQLRLNRHTSNQSDYGGESALSSESSQRSRTHGARRFRANIQQQLGQSIQEKQLYRLQFPGSPNFRTHVPTEYRTTLEEPYDNHSAWNGKNSRNYKFETYSPITRPPRARAMPMDNYNNIGDTLLNPIHGLNLGSDITKPERSLTRTQRYTAVRSVRNHVGVGLTYNARLNANKPKVYAYDPLDNRPKNALTINQKHAIAASKIPAVHEYNKIKEKFHGRHHARDAIPFKTVDALDIRPNILQPQLHKTYNQRKRPDPAVREQFGKYGDSTAQRAILRAPKDSTITLNNRGQLVSIDPGYRQPTKLAIRRARSAPDTSSIVTHEKPKVETAVRSRKAIVGTF